VPKSRNRGSDRCQYGSGVTSRLAFDFLQKNNHSTLPRTTRRRREFNPQNVVLAVNEGLSHLGSVSVHLTRFPFESLCSNSSGCPVRARLGIKSTMLPST